ncbi:MAG: helix-turn-helix transcriptional regulator [Sphingomonadales bacterium]|nr:helix-turn-helix transcriptional regulator [Sphingomonadales bacterium]
MSSPKSGMALLRLGQDIRNARLRRGISIADLALRAGTSTSSVARLERGDPGLGIGTLADILVALGLIDRLADLIDIRKDDLGLALAAEQLPQRGKSSSAMLRKKRSKLNHDPSATGAFDRDGIGF